MEDASLTIARAAEAAEVGVETVRYYERRGLIAQPPPRTGAYRRYGHAHVERIRFIRRAQELGFALDEIGELLALEDGTDRRSIRRIASKRLEQIRERIVDLQRMEKALAHLLHDCEVSDGKPHCPIISALISAGRRGQVV